MRNIILIFIRLIIVIMIQIFCIVILLKENIFKFINLDSEINDFCQIIKNISNNNLDYYVCDNKFKKSKNIILFIDSLPFDVLHDFHNLKDIKITNFFRVKGIEYKQSGALFETILTGKFSRNYLASNEIKMDNLQKQFNNANMTTFYRVKKYPLYNLLNKTKDEKNIIETYDGEGFPLISFCDINIKPIFSFGDEIYYNYFDNSGFYFKEGITKEYFYKLADKKLKQEFQKIRKEFDKCLSDKGFNSYLFFTDVLDHINHVYHRNSPLAIYSVYIIEKIVKELINWINTEHEEYALALASDHGGQIYNGEDTLCNHGCNRIGNEGVFFIYTKELGENYEKYKTFHENKEIPIVPLNDFPCTLSQVLKNTNLPLESTCIPRYIGNDKLIFFSSVKSKEIQLKQYIEKLIKKYPHLKNKFHEKYEVKLKNNKFNSYFQDFNSIYQVDNIFYDNYMKYLIDIQNKLLNDLVKSGKNKIYYLIFYSILIMLIIGFIYYIRKIIVLTRVKIIKEKRKGIKKNFFLNKLISYIYILIIILLIDPLICIIYNNSSNISYYINISILIKFLSLLFLVISVTYLNKIKNYNYKKLIFIITFIVFINSILAQIELFSWLDKFINTQKKIDFFKRYLSYPLIIIYGSIELYSNRNYYFFQINKSFIKYIYIVIPYLIILTYNIFKYDFYIKIKSIYGQSPEEINLMKKIYRMIFGLLLFIKPFKRDDKNGNIIISSDIINLKLFLFTIVIFICIELERIEMILLFIFILFYLCICFKNEEDIFIKIIYIVLIITYPQIHFIANQGTYTMDTSIKVTNKVPSKWADDRPIAMGVIFVVNKFRFNIMVLGYLFTLIKISNKKILYYYAELIRLIYSIQLIGNIICFLYYLKKEREASYIQILYLITTQAMAIIIFDFTFLVNYIIYKIVYLFDVLNTGLNYENINNKLENNNFKVFKIVFN